MEEASEEGANAAATKGETSMAAEVSMVEAASTVADGGKYYLPAGSERTSRPRHLKNRSGRQNVLPAVTFSSLYGFISEK